MTEVPPVLLDRPENEVVQVYLELREPPLLGLPVRRGPLGCLAPQGETGLREIQDLVAETVHLVSKIHYTLYIIHYCTLTLYILIRFSYSTYFGEIVTQI